MVTAAVRLLASTTMLVQSHHGTANDVDLKERQTSDRVDSINPLPWKDCKAEHRGELTRSAFSLSLPQAA